MLLAIKDRITGMFAWFIVILISVPFVLWGVQEYTGIGQDNFAVKVNDAEISLQDFDREMTRSRQQLLQSFGGRMPTYFDAESFLRSQTLSMLINRELFKQITEDNHYRIAPQQVIATITADPVFQTNGEFDPDAYAGELRSRGMSKQGYEKLLRDQMLAMQVQASIRKSAFVTQEEVADYARLRHQKRSFEYVRLPLEKLKKQVSEVTEQDIEDYYAKNSEGYKTEEKVAIEYVELNLAELAANVSVDDATLKNQYDKAIEGGRFGTSEVRNASHILIKVPVDATEEVIAEKRKEILVLRERIIKGDSFSEIAKESSDDPGSAANGGELGDIQIGAMVKPFEDAVYAAELNKVTEPVKTRFGFHLILVNEIIESKVQSFEEVKEILDKEYRRAEVEPEFYELLDNLANSAFENPDDLAVVAEIVGAEVKKSDWFTVSKGEGIATTALVRETAFSDEVLKDGNNSAPIEVEPEYVLVLRIAEHDASRTMTLDEARTQINETLKAERATQALQDVVQKVLSGAQTGTSLKMLSKTNAGEYKSAETNRDDSEIPREIIQKVFAMHMSSPVEKSLFANGDGAVIKLNKLVDSDVNWLKPEEREKMVNELLQARGQYDLASLMDGMKENAEITIHPDLQ